HFDGVNHDCYAAHVVGFPRREGETLQEYFGRPEFVRKVDAPIRPLIPYEPMSLELKREGVPYVCNDLLANEGWYEHEFVMAACGVRAYAAIPMIVRERMIGAASFSRLAVRAFTEFDVAILGDISRALAVAVANALANEEIHKLRDQLEQENFNL